jgi:hypothetical protein
MSEQEGTGRSAVMVYFPMFIATLSLCTSIYNGYLNNKFVELIQRNLGRAEYMHTCKEIIDAYFQVKVRAGLVSETGERERSGGPAPVDGAAVQIEAANAVNKFAALGTYLANLRDERIRARYTELSGLLEKAVADARNMASAAVAKSFEPADAIFSEMNNDCVASAKL